MTTKWQWLPEQHRWRRNRTRDEASNALNMLQAHGLSPDDPFAQAAYDVVVGLSNVQDCLPPQWQLPEGAFRPRYWSARKNVKAMAAFLKSKAIEVKTYEMPAR